MVALRNNRAQACMLHSAEGKQIFREPGAQTHQLWVQMLTPATVKLPPEEELMTGS